MKQKKTMLIILAPCLMILTSIFLSNIRKTDNNNNQIEGTLISSKIEISTEAVQTVVVPKLERVGASLTRTQETSTEEPTTTAPPEPVLTTMWCSVSLNLREQPSTDSSVLHTARKGTEVIAIDYDEGNEWTKVSLNEMEGFMSTAYLSAEYINKYTYYYVVEGGQAEELDPALQEYGQDLIISLGMEEYIPYWYVQCYQESRFRMTQSGHAHGGYYDWGIMQIWEGLEHDKYSGIYTIIQQHPNYKTDPYDNITCGIYQFYRWYKDYGGDIQKALGSYYSGVFNQPYQKYIDDVMSHWNNLYTKQQ